MKQFNAERELKKLERELGKVGTRASKPFIARVKELIVELSKFKGVKIERMVMGMGGWALVGTLPFKEYWGENLSKVEEGDHDFELSQFDTVRNCWMEYYDNVNPGISAVCTELNDILSILTYNKYLDTFDIPADEMKKLLRR